MAELVMVDEDAGHVDLIVNPKSEWRVQTAPRWPKCEDEPCHMHELFSDDLDQAKLNECLERLRANPFVEIGKSGLVMPDGMEKAAAAPDESTRKYYETIGKRTSLSLIAHGQVRNPARVYHARTLPPEGGGLRVGVFRGEEQIGEYQRNYHSLFGGFYPFAWKGNHYALYSPDYTGTRIMSLPDCQDIGGEDRDAGGFCPVDFYVPCSPLTGEMAGFGFVSGCIWGDDCSWKLEHLDLTRADEGILVRSDRFGYVELPGDMELWEAVRVRWEYVDDGGPWDWVDITTQKAYRLDTGEAAY